jgi:uncharacterized delta-60 repeat protein
MALTSKINLGNNKYCQSTGSTLSLSGSTSIGFAQYLEDVSDSYNARSLTDAGFVTGCTSLLQSEINYISGVTDQVISNIDYISGVTSGNSENIQTLFDLVALGVTGATNGLTLTGQTVQLGGALSGDTDIDLGFNILRILVDNLTTGYTFGNGFNVIVQAIAIQSDNKILVGGNFTTYDGVTSNYIIRLNSDGTIDDTFSIGTGFNGNVISIAVQSDNKILVGGTFTTYSGTTSNYIVRLNSDGTIDDTFSIGTGFNDLVTSIIVQSDNKILVGGNFTTYSGETSSRIIRLNSDGSVDNSFSVGTGFNNLTISIAVQSDNKILVGGLFTTYSGVTSNYIVRLNSDGSIDDAFSIGTGFDNNVNDIKIQSDNKILVGGNFTTYSGVTSNRIIRLNSDGTIDNTFSIGTGFGSYVNHIAIQSDNKILVGGNFTTYSGVTSNGVIRLNSDGSIDNTFSIGTGFNNTVFDIAVQSDNKIVVGGKFTTYSGESLNRIVRLESDGSIEIKITGGDNITSFNNGLITYGGDYSPQFTDRTLVDKGYVDNSVGVTITGATNGLTVTGQTVQLGGILSENTTISGGSSNLSLGTQSSLIDCFNLKTNTGFNLSTGTATQGPSISTDYCCLRLNYVDDYSSSGTTTGFQISGGEIMVVDLLNARPMYYCDDYSVNIQPRSIPDAEWVTGQTITNQFVTGATNGLNLTNNQIGLGGILSENTSISGGSSHNLCLGTILSPLDNLVVRTNTGFNLSTGTATQGPSISTDYCCLRLNYVDDYSTSGTTTGFEISGGDLKVVDYLNARPMYYAADYSANIEPRSIPDAEWVTGQTSSIIGGNGLTRVGNEIQLGGTLSANTTIDGDYILTLAPSNDLQLRSTGGNRINIDSQDNGSVSIKSQSGNTTTATSFVCSVGVFMDYNQPSGFIIYDNRQGTNQTGIVYAGDYSTNYVERSLVDKAYVDAVATGLQVKAAVIAATTEDIDLTGGTFTGTIDNIGVVDGHRILIKDQTNPIENGIWVYSAGTNTFYRASDFDGTPSGEVVNGNIIPVSSGTSYQNAQFVLTTPDPITVDVDELNFSVFSYLLQIGAGSGIEINSVSNIKEISLQLANNSGLEFVGLGLSVANEIAGSGLTWNSGVLSVNASSTEITGNEISVRFGTNNNLFIDSDDIETITASNGLTKVDSNITLGGTLTGNTTIQGSAGQYDLSFLNLNSFSLSFNNTSTITDNSASPSGLTYALDYSDTFVNNSLITKKYVDDRADSNNRYHVTGYTASTVNLNGGEFAVLIDTTSNPVTVNLFSTPSIGYAVKIKDIGNALTNNITIDAGGGKFIDGSQTATINTDYGAVELVYGETNNWYVLSFVN